MNSKVKYIIGFISIAFLVFCLWYFRSILTYLIIAAAMSFIGQPIVKLISKIKYKKYHIPIAINAFLTLAIMWTAIIIFFKTFIPLIVNEINELSNIDVNSIFVELQDPLTKIQLFLQKAGYFNGEETLRDILSDKAGSILNVNYLSTLLGNITSILGSILIGVFSISFFSFFFLKDASLFSNGVLMFFSDKRTDEVSNILSSTRQLLSRYLTGVIIQIILIMTLVTLGLWLVGMGFQHALICGLFSGIINVIPYVGPWIGATFGITIGIATNLQLPFEPDMVHFISFLLLVYILIQLADNILFQPLIFANTVKAHPIEIFIVILMAGSFAGILGMVLAIPIYTVFRVIAKEFFSNFKIVKKLTQNI